MGGDWPRVEAEVCDGGLFPSVLPSLSGLGFWDGSSQEAHETREPEATARKRRTRWGCHTLTQQN